MAAAALVTPHAGAQETLEARQGYPMTTTKQSCTIAFNDPARHVSFTSAHCGETGDTVYLPDAGGTYRAAGKLVRSRAYNEQELSNDWATIQWSNVVEVKGNEFSGGTVVPPEQLNKGDELCLRGNRTHGSTPDAVSCGTYAGAVNNMLFIDGAHGQKGDSGGVVFAPGRGFVGIYSGFNAFELEDGRTIRLERVTVARDGEVTTREQQWDFAREYFDQRVGTMLIDDTPSQTPKPPSSLSPGAIVGIVLAVLAVVVPIAVFVLQQL